MLFYMNFLIIAVLLIPFLKIHRGQMTNILIISILGGGIHFAFFYLALDNSRFISSVLGSNPRAFINVTISFEEIIFDNDFVLKSL